MMFSGTFCSKTRAFSALRLSFLTGALVYSLSLFSGCSAGRSLLFGIFEGGYSGGGTTTTDKERHFSSSLGADQDSTSRAVTPLIRDE